MGNRPENHEGMCYILNQLEKKTTYKYEDGFLWKKKRDGTFRKMGTPERDGYQKVSFAYEKKLVHMMAHRIIYSHVFGRIPAGLEINHIDGDKTNNLPSNLEAVTHDENMKHAMKSKLFKKQVFCIEKIRELRKISHLYTTIELSQMYGVTGRTIRYNLSKKTHRGQLI